MLEVLDEGLAGRAVEYANARRFTPVGVRTVLLLLAPVKEVHPVHLAVNCQ
jgi:hypothetical protein